MTASSTGVGGSAAPALLRCASRFDAGRVGARPGDVDHGFRAAIIRL